MNSDYFPFQDSKGRQIIQFFGMFTFLERRFYKVVIFLRNSKRFRSTMKREERTDSGFDKSSGLLQVYLYLNYKKHIFLELKIQL